MKMYKTDLFKYLAGEMFSGREWTLTIEYVRTEEIRGHKEVEEKPVMYFQEVQKGLVVNKTNAKYLIGLFGTDETEDWRGKRITLYTEKVNAFGKIHDAIRVKESAIDAMPPEEVKKAAKKGSDAMRGDDEEAYQHLDDMINGVGDWSDNAEKLAARLVAHYGAKNETGLANWLVEYTFEGSETPQYLATQYAKRKADPEQAPLFEAEADTPNNYTDEAS